MDVEFEVWEEEESRDQAISVMMPNGKANGRTAKAAAAQYAIRKGLSTGYYVFCVAKPCSNFVATVDLVIRIDADCRGWRDWRIDNDEQN